MKADDAVMRSFLEGSKQFVVPLFQRTYSWDQHNITQLWDDIDSIRRELEAEDGTIREREPAHFFGSFVTMPIDSFATNVSRFLIIDGQQRLVTTLMLLAALRDRMNEIQPGNALGNEIYNLYLTNEYHPENKYKVVPTHIDREVFFGILEGSIPKERDGHLIIRNYDWFMRRLGEINEMDELKAIRKVVLSNFTVVDICLERGDNPYLIFESLNGRGTPLTQADLVRNYLFMRIPDDSKHQDIYDHIWLPIQRNLEEELEHFFRHYLAMRGDIPNIKDVYMTFKDETDKKAHSQEDVIDTMRDLLKYSTYYHRFLVPTDEDDDQLRSYFEKFNKLKQTTPYPLMLKLYDDYSNEDLECRDFTGCLNAVETYLVRRAACGIPAQGLHKYFPTVYESLDKGDVVNSLRKKLHDEGGARRLPTDDEFVKNLKERALYGNEILRYLLEEIEKHENKEVVDFNKLEIEHIMPQKLSDEWKKMLGSDWDSLQRKYLDTLGNLTLTGYNQEYSNRAFTVKRDMKDGFKDSRLRLNRDVAGLDKWTATEIEKRAERLTKNALEIWSY